MHERASVCRRRGLISATRNAAERCRVALVDAKRPDHWRGARQRTSRQPSVSLVRFRRQLARGVCCYRWRRLVRRNFAYAAIVAGLPAATCATRCADSRAEPSGAVGRRHVAANRARQARRVRLLHADDQRTCQSPVARLAANVSPARARRPLLAVGGRARHHCPSCG